jgi:type II secretory pathway component PulF
VPNEEPADFRTDRKRANWPWTCFWLIIHGIAWGLLLALLSLVVPKFEAVFADFGVPLPELSIRVIDASHKVRVHLLLLLPFSVLVLAADALILETFRRRGIVAGSRRWSTLMIVTPLLLAAVTVVAVILPLFTVDQKLSG